jgi:EmrB/QacA subfamily drug resistance transporter
VVQVHSPSSWAGRLRRSALSVPSALSRDRTRRPRTAAQSTVLLISVAAGSFMVIFDGAAFQMALPLIQRSLGGTALQVQWTMTAFLLLSTSTLLPWGRAGDVLGRGRIWRAGILVFVASSMACAVAPTLGWVVVARAGQGIGAAMTTANSAPILVDAFPEKGGRMLGLGNIALALGMVAGPPLGALLTSSWSWRGILIVAIPVGAFVWWSTRGRLPASPRLKAPLDVWSGVLSVIGLGATLLGGTFGHRWGWLAPETLASFAVGAIGLTAFLVRQARTAQPIVKLALLRDRLFASGMLSSFFGFAALFAALAGLPFLLIVVQSRGLSETGVLVGVLPLVLSLTAPVAGALADRIGSRLLCTVSLLGLGAALTVITTAGDKVGVGRLLWALALAGAGLGGFEAPNDVEVLRSLPSEKLGSGTALLGAARNLGMTFGVALGSTLLDYALAHATGSHSERLLMGVQWAMAAGAAAALLGALSALVRPGGRTRRRTSKA